MFQTLVNAFKQKDIRKKLLIILAILLVYRIGCWIPIPGLNIEEGGVIAGLAGQDFLSLLSAVSGGALANGSLLALGVVPYISASIIMQLLTVAIPPLERLSRAGEDGRKKIALYTRIAALVFSIIQAIAIVVALNGNGAINTTLFGDATPAWIVPAIIVLVLVAGGMFTLWLGEKITDLGIGNGVSLMVFVGILSSAGTALLNAVKGASDISVLWDIIIFVAILIVIFAAIVFVDLAERKIPVQYAKQVKGRKMYGGQSTMIPIKVNSNGVLPIIFATALVTFPQLIIQMFWPDSGANAWYAEWLGAGTPLYFVFNALFIFFFSYFYSQITFNPEEVSRNLQQSGGFIPGIRAGRPTTDYLKKISGRITFFGASYLTIIFIIPTLIFSILGLGIGAADTNTMLNAFSVTGMLIVVSVALEFDKQLDAQMLMKNYRGFLK
ncbi:MAG: preprotein translocase subunit SecY [Clostridia bacterium]|nr:preprotein translocase subunit SecY [Clostridia bacterium]